MELVDTPGLGPGGVSLGGSSPFDRTRDGSQASGRRGCGDALRQRGLHAIY